MKNKEKRKQTKTNKTHTHTNQTNKQTKSQKHCFLLWRDIEKNLPLDINSDDQIANCISYTIRQKTKCLTQIAQLSPNRSIYNTSKDLKVLITIELK